MNDLLVMAQIASRRCAMHARDVESVIEIGAITPVPQAPDFITGITAMRSQALTVIDCRCALGLNPGQFALDERAIVVESAGYYYALRVDTIEDITAGGEETKPVPGGFGEQWSRVARGLIETRSGPALLLDLPALISGPDPIGTAA